MSYMLTTSPTLEDEVREHYNKVLLYWAKPKLVHARFARKYQVPQHEGRVINWRRFSRLATATTPLAEGVTPSPATLTVTKVSVTVNQYGNWVGFSDLVNVLSIDPVMMENSEILSYNSGETMDEVARDAMVAGTNVRYANGRVSRATIVAGDVITDTEIQYMRRDLARQDTLSVSVDGNLCYVAYVHPDVFMNLQRTDAFKLSGYYQSKELVFSGQVTKLWGIMFIESTKAKIYPAGTGGAGAVDVYITMVHGDHAFGDVSIASLGLRQIFKGLESGGSSDPLEQRQTQAWKGTYNAKILNELFILRFESAAGT